MNTSSIIRLLMVIVIFLPGSAWAGIYFQVVIESVKEDGTLKYVDYWRLRDDPRSELVNLCVGTIETHYRYGETFVEFDNVRCEADRGPAVVPTLQRSSYGSYRIVGTQIYSGETIDILIRAGPWEYNLNRKGTGATFTTTESWCIQGSLVRTAGIPQHYLDALTMGEWITGQGYRATARAEWCDVVIR